MAASTPVCALLSDIIDRTAVMAVTRLDIPLPLQTSPADCTLLSAQVVRAETATASGSLPLCGAVEVEVEVEVVCDDRLLAVRCPVDLTRRRPLPAGNSRLLVQDPKVTVLRQQGMGPQERHLVLAGLNPGDQFGFAVTYLGDLDGDGVPDLAVGAPSTNNGALVDAGAVFFYSGATGAPLRRVSGTVAGAEFGFALAAAGDVNGDGIPDLLVGAPGPHGGSGSAFVISGRDGSVLRMYSSGNNGDQFGWSVTSPGDLDGDGVPEVAVGAPSSAPGGRADAGSVYLFSGATGTLLARFDGANPGDAFGFAVGSPGDVTGDRIPDLLVGASQASPFGLEQAGTAILVSGRPPYPTLFTWNGMSPGEGLGWMVTGTGDIDGDGIPDVMIGAPGTGPFLLEQPGKLDLFSGATGALIRTLQGSTAGDSFGESAVPVQVDGALFYLVGSPDAGPALSQGRADLLRPEFILRTFQGISRFDQFGWSVAADPVQGSLAIGAPDASPGGRTNAGTVDLFIAGTNRLRIELCIEATLVIERIRQLTLSTSGPC